MRFGIPHEGRISAVERRVPLTPDAVRALVEEGAEVLVEQGAGLAAGIADARWEAAGARLLPTRAELIDASDAIVCLSRLVEADLPHLRPETPVLALHRLEEAPRPLRRAFAARELVAIGIDRLRDERGAFPVRAAMQELAGAMAPSLAARLLESGPSGRAGLLLTRLPGLLPPEFLVLGAGPVGLAAARSAASLGLSVRVLDADLRRLRELQAQLPAVSTAISTPELLAESARQAHVLVATPPPHSGPAPLPSPPALPEALVATLRPGAVIVDLSEGASVPTAPVVDRLEDAPLIHGVWHLALREPTALVAQTASQLFSAALLPYVQLLATGVTPKAHRAFAPAIYFGEGLEEGPDEDPQDGG